MNKNIENLLRNNLLKKRILPSWKSLGQKLFSTLQEQDSTITNKKEKTAPIEQGKTEAKKKTIHDNEDWRKPQKETSLEQLKRYREYLIYLQKKKGKELETVSYPNINEQNTPTTDKEKGLVHKNND